MNPSLLLTTLLGGTLDPSLLRPADAIPGQVPDAVVVLSEAPDDRRLRGDFEIPGRVLLVFTADWPRATARIAEQVLDSGAGLALVADAGSSPAAYARFVNELTQPSRGRVEAHTDRVDTPWVRDWGPLQLHREGRSPAALWLDAQHPGDGREHDDAAPRWIADHHGVDLLALPWALDGGAFISDGAGLCVLSFEYLELRGITKGDPVGAAVLGQLLGGLGCRATALIPTLLDEHTKHVDMIAQFVGPNRLMIASIEDPHGPSEDALRLAAAELGIRQAARALGRSLEIIPVPTPPSTPGHNPRTHVNGLRLADRYLMPGYPELGQDLEDRARAAVQLAVAEVPVVVVDASEMIAAGGAIHCAALGLFVP
ncbi:Agmatine deiminase [Enhygromyxa salina]|uniref:Agmatine deiminase n=1 Tax=Enhygromyxa salina TaxID=215803 RepID=A0A0C1ZAT3_9BACT|nr:agmatine deiminase family protein [Enhygromyxa salina]KIG14744.1 Agmatine deiminase [Enhygromyxa salina]